MVMYYNIVGVIQFVFKIKKINYNQIITEPFYCHNMVRVEREIS